MHTPEFAVFYTNTDEQTTNANPLQINATVKSNFSASIGSYHFDNQQLFDDCSDLINVAIDIPFVRQLSTIEQQKAVALLDRYVFAWCDLVVAEWMRTDTLEKYCGYVDDYLNFCQNQCDDVVNFHEWVEAFPIALPPLEYDGKNRDDFMAYLDAFNGYDKEKALMLSVLDIFEAILQQ